MNAIKPIKILLAEDNPDHAELTIDTLNESGVKNQIFHVENGQECLDFMRNEGKYTDEKAYPKPNLILLDIRMPKLDGLEVLKTIKLEPKWKQIPVVMLTTSKKEEEILSSYEYGANSYVTKPVSFEEFSQKIKQLQLYWVLVTETPQHDE